MYLLLYEIIRHLRGGAVSAGGICNKWLNSNSEINKWEDKNDDRREDEKPENQ